MGKQIQGTSTFSGTDLTGAGGKSAAPGGLICYYTNNLGFDVDVVVDVRLDGLDANAANFTMWAYIEISSQAYDAFLGTQAKSISTRERARVISDRALPIINGSSVKIFVYSSNGSDTNVSGYIYLFDKHSNVDVISQNDRESLLEASDVTDDLLDAQKSGHTGDLVKMMDRIESKG